jgi:hypothetical protein
MGAAMKNRIRLIIFALVSLSVMAVLAVAQPVETAAAAEVAPELPGFLLAFAAGHWWVVPTYGLIVMVVTYVDAAFFTEEWKAKWPGPARSIWNFVAANIGKSKNQGAA